MSGQPASGFDQSIGWVVRQREGLLAEGEERQPRHAGLEIDQRDGVQLATDKAHGWRETMVADPDGYVWAIGEAI